MVTRENAIGRVESNQGGVNWDAALNSHEETYASIEQPSPQLPNSFSVDTIAPSTNTSISVPEEPTSLPTYQNIIDTSKRMWDSIYSSVLSFFSPAVSQPQLDNTPGIKPIGAPALQPPPPMQYAETRRLIEQLRKLMEIVQSSSQKSLDQLSRENPGNVERMLIEALLRMHAIHQSHFALKKSQVVQHQTHHKEITEEWIEARGKNSASQKRLGRWKWLQRGAVGLSIAGQVAMTIFTFMKKPEKTLEVGFRLTKSTLEGAKALTSLFLQGAQHEVDKALSHLEDLEFFQNLNMGRISEDMLQMQRAGQTILKIFVDMWRLEASKHKMIKYILRP